MTGATPDLLRVPPAFAARTVEREKAAGQAWIDGLPGLVARILREWRLTLVAAPVSGTVGLVWEVRRADGSAGMLKVGWRDAETRHEAEALRRWAGRGAVRLVESSDDDGALLLERLDPGTSLGSLEIGGALEVAAQVLNLLHVPAWPGFDDAFGQRLGGPEPSDAYRERLRELGRDVEQAFRNAPRVVLHGDLHYENVLRSGSSWRAIDPKPALGPREWDLVPLLRNRFDELPQGAVREQGIRDRLDTLVAATGSDPGRAYLFARYRALRDADYARRVGDRGFEDVSTAIAAATAR